MRSALLLVAVLALVQGGKSPTEKLEKSRAMAEHRKWVARDEAGRVALREKAAKAGTLAEEIQRQQMVAERKAKVAALKPMHPVVDANEAMARGLLDVVIVNQDWLHRLNVPVGERYHMEIGGSTTVAHLKVIIADQHHFGFLQPAAQELRLHPNGPELDPLEPLEAQGIDFGTEIYLKINEERYTAFLRAHFKKCECDASQGGAIFTTCQHRMHVVSPSHGRQRYDGVPHMVSHVRHKQMAAHAAGVKGFSCTRAGFKKDPKAKSQSAPKGIPVCKCCECAE